jgi:CheY-like chemotaxis protein
METNSGKILNVLLADDDPDDRMLFEDAVSGIDAAITLSMAKDGEELMQMLNTAILLPDVLFLDLNMPRKNGFECLEEIRANRNFNDIFISIYSTTASSREMEETFNKGANLFINKPNTFSELKAMLSKVFSLDREEYLAAADKNRFTLNGSSRW